MVSGLVAEVTRSGPGSNPLENIAWLVNRTLHSRIFTRSFEVVLDAYVIGKQVPTLIDLSPPSAEL